MKGQVLIQGTSGPTFEMAVELHRQIDEAVLCAYGWGDISLGHDFHEVACLPENDYIRFTISETARVDVLRRLSELNRQRYDEEVAQGLHGKAKTGASKGRAKGVAGSQGALKLEDEPASLATNTSTPFAFAKRGKRSGR